MLEREYSCGHEEEANFSACDLRVELPRRRERVKAKPQALRDATASDEQATTSEATTMHENPDGGVRKRPNGWNRDAVTFRLTPERKKALFAALGEDSQSASPTEAMDLAIELASVSRNRAASDACGSVPAEIARLLDAIRLETRSLSASIETWTGAHELLARLAAECAELRHAVKSAALLADGVRVSDQSAPTPIKELLDELGTDVAWAVFKTRWTGKRPAGSGMAFWDVDLRELRAAGEARAITSLATLGPAPSKGPLTGIEESHDGILSCARRKGGWTLTLRAPSAQGKLGEPFAQWSV